MIKVISLFQKTKNIVETLRLIKLPKKVKPDTFFSEAGFLYTAISL